MNHTSNTINNTPHIPISRRLRIIRKTMAEEGGYVDNPKLIDQPTNTGITQQTLKDYNTAHPNFGFPNNLKEITANHAEQIYATEYYDKRHIDDIKNERIASAVFDMGVMSNFNNIIKLVQKTINDVMHYNITTDGIMGSETIMALNSIPDIKTEDFMNTLKTIRLNYLHGLKDWEKYGRGWTARTNRY